MDAMNKLVIGALAVGTCALAANVLSDYASSYRTWQQQERDRILSGGMLAETSVGPVEYQLIERAGSGPAVIYAHGTPGGFDQGTAFARFLGAERCTFISPSRPGYLRTPLDSGASPQEQADLYAALLDVLGIDRASIIGFSGGGPSALQFALRHPERCRSLVIVSGIVQRHHRFELQQALPLPKRLTAQLIDRLLISDPFLYLALSMTSFMPSGDAVAGMLCSGSLYPLRKVGYENDLAQFAAIEDYPLEKITVPTLVVHGAKDEDVSFEHARLLVRALPKVTLLAITGSGHEGFYTAARTVVPAIRNFLS
jgi:pimeloyl-ACP methyl ester carboxylesterase